MAATKQFTLTLSQARRKLEFYLNHDFLDWNRVVSLYVNRFCGMVVEREQQYKYSPK